MLHAVRLSQLQQRSLRIRPILPDTEFNSMPAASCNSVVGSSCDPRCHADDLGGYCSGLSAGLHNSSIQCDKLIYHARGMLSIVSYEGFTRLGAALTIEI